MSIFKKDFNSFDDLYESIFRGNEIEFQYGEKQYYILPYFNKSGIVIGVLFGEAYSEKDLICFSKEELYNARIENTNFGTVFSQIKITWRNI